jgi:hypothetical protein
VNLNWWRIITTNYDRLLETASERMHVPFDTLHYASPELKISENRDKKCIIHLHGDATNQSSPLILAKEDYDSLYLSDESKTKYYYSRTIGGTLRQAGVILFLGYSHDDAYVASLFDSSLAGIDGPVFALVPRKEEQVDFETNLLKQSKKNNIRYISFSRDDNYRELPQLLEYLKNPPEFDELYEWQLSVRRPTVVFLRCGGTIGAKSKPTDEGYKRDIDHVKSRYDKELAELAAKALKRYRRYSKLPLEIAWEILPPEQQLLSENAVVEDWNNVTRKLQTCFLKYFVAPDRVGPNARIHDADIHRLFKEEAEQFELTFPGQKLGDRAFMDGFRNRYVLGIVLLYGTDTLAFLASALSFSLRHIPCSIIVTGANQPLDPRTIAGSGEFDNPSDGWRNLFNTLFFLQCFGHRLTELFVVFGDTVHHGVNLRKRAIDIIPFDREQIQQADLESFMYRNLSLTGQYMFRLIDGVFCNNYYAATTQNYRRLLQEHDDLLHLRQNPFLTNQTTIGLPEPISGCVKFLELSPSFPQIDVASMLKEEIEIRAVLVEGYNSGTYPSVNSHNFALFLAKLQEHGIPLLLVSRYGIRATQEEYKTLKVEGKFVPVLRLYGVIAETALPLLSLVVGRIKAQRWNPVAAPAEGMAEYRRQLIKKELEEFFETHRNILTEELKYSIDRAFRFQRMIELREIDEKHRTRRERSDGSQWRRPATTSQDRPRTKLAAVPRVDFLNFIEDSVEQFERVGARPDGFLTLNSQGFALGDALARSFEERSSQHSYPWKPFYDREPTERYELSQRANLLLQDVTARLAAAGIAEIKTLPLKFEEDDASERAYFTFEANVSRAEPVGRNDERYSATALSEQDVALFVALQHGCLSGENARAHEAKLQYFYERAVLDTWPVVTHNLDWFIIGFFKGICCALIGLLGFDQEPDAPQLNPSVGRRRALRQSVQCELFRINKHQFGLRFRCFEQAVKLTTRMESNQAVMDEERREPMSS